MWANLCDEIGNTVAEFVETPETAQYNPSRAGGGGGRSLLKQCSTICAPTDQVNRSGHDGLQEADRYRRICATALSYPP